MRSVAGIGLAGIALLAAAGASAQAPTSPAETFAGLTGSCWRAALPDGASDTHCFTVAVGGKLVMDVHKVRNASGVVVYEGVTTYRVERESGAIRYEYLNSNGDLLPGYGKRLGDQIAFSATPDGPSTLVWFIGAEAYEVHTTGVAAFEREFVKAGPARNDGL